jgi:hypothetical protein
MKNLLMVAMIIVLLFTLYSCSKNNTETGSLIGNWIVVKDSTHNTNAIYSLSAGDSGISTNNYNGEQCGATFNFNSNGLLSTHYFMCTYGLEGPIDSANYVVKDNRVAISIFAQGRDAGPSTFIYFNPGFARTCTISNLTANTATLTFHIDFAYSAPVGGSMVEIINLEK